MIHVTWVSAHGALTHFPIAMLIGMLAFDLGAALFKKPEWKVVSFWMLVTAVVACIPALFTGLQTAGSLFDGSLPPVAALHRNLAYATSILAFVILVLRARAGDKLTGGLVGAVVALTFVAVAIVSWTGYLGGAMMLGEAGSPAEAPARQTAVGTAPAPSGAEGAFVAKGKGIYSANNCSNCHKIDGAGGSGGPDLSHEGSDQPDAAWQVAHLKDPQKTRPNSFMPKYARLGDDNLKALAAYLVSLK